MALTVAQSHLAAGIAVDKGPGLFFRAELLEAGSGVAFHLVLAFWPVVALYQKWEHTDFVPQLPEKVFLSTD